MPQAYLEVNQVAILEKSATNLRDRLLIRLLFHLGCRVSEALSITVEDIDFAAGTVRIQHLKMRIRLNCKECGARLSKSHTFCPRCGVTVKEVVAKEMAHHKMRTLPLEKETLSILQEYVDRGGPVKRGNQTFIFDIGRHRAWQVVAGLAEKAGLPRLSNPESGRSRNVSPHRLRDAFAVHAMKSNSSGDSLRMLQEHLGHSSFNTTARYRKVGGSELQEWYSKLWAEKEKSDGTEAK
jgi:integrase/recombinase XerD